MSSDDKSAGKYATVDSQTVNSKKFPKDSVNGEAGHTELPLQKNLDQGILFKDIANYKVKESKRRRSRSKSRAKGRKRSGSRRSRSKGRKSSKGRKRGASKRAKKSSTRRKRRSRSPAAPAPQPT